MQLFWHTSMICEWHRSSWHFLYNFFRALLCCSGLEEHRSNWICSCNFAGSLPMQNQNAEDKRASRWNTQVHSGGFMHQ